MALHDPAPEPPELEPSRSLLYADLAQVWPEAGGGVCTYLRHKRRHILDHRPHGHLIVIPGPADGIEASEGGRAITVRIASPRVPGHPNHRLLLRNGAVRKVLERFRPDLIECQDGFTLPWAAIACGRRNPGTALVAAYSADFPTAYLNPVSRWLGSDVGKAASRIGHRYCAHLYRRFDAVTALSENGAATLRALGLPDVAVVPIGEPQSSWDQAMSRLFGHVYRTARLRAARRSAEAALFQMAAPAA